MPVQDEPGSELPRVLLIADTPEELSWLSFVLRRQTELSATADVGEAIRLLESSGPFAVLLGGEMLTGESGGFFLEKMRAIAPETTRILLIGEESLRGAFDVINAGRVFRAILKPCAPSAIVQTIEEAATRHQRALQEKNLLRRTLQGSVAALVGVMRGGNPLILEKAQRIRDLTRELAGGDLAEDDQWASDAAAMLSQLGYALLARETLEKVYSGQELSTVEQDKVARLPRATDQILEPIPQLEPVRSMLLYAQNPTEESLMAVPGRLRRGALALRIAIALDLLRGQGHTIDSALDRLRERGGYDQKLLDHYLQLHPSLAQQEGTREVPLAQVQPGMVICDDVRSPSGLLLIPRDFRVTQNLCTRILNFPEQMLRQPVRIRMDNGEA